MSRKLEVMNRSELEARLSAAHELRRDELLPWLEGALRRLLDVIAGLGSRGHRGAHSA